MAWEQVARQSVRVPKTPNDNEVPMARPSSPLLRLAILAPVLALPACAEKAPPGAPPAPVPYAEAILYNTQGQQSGKVTLIPNNGMLDGKISVTGLTPGDHGMHIHTVGKCTLPDFASAGGHLNPDGKQHGTQNPGGPHQGDLPVLTVSSSGAAEATFMTHTSFDALFDADGSSFVVHEKTDDMKTDPSGNSGTRQLCGVLYKKMP